MASAPRSEDPGYEVVRWYTRARKFPQLIGKTPSGGTIWGGPYTYTQLGAGVLVLVVGLKTTWLWGQFGLIGNAVVVLGVAYGVTLLVGKLPVGMRNPLSMAAGAVRALSRPAQGALGGTALRIRPPHVVGSRVVVNHGTPVADVVDDVALGSRSSERRGGRRRRRGREPERPLTQVRRPGPLRPTPATARAVQAPAPALTGVQQLLASAGSTHQQEDD
ncbi:hypothetical protein [Cellulosimicrobium cellulans]|uniref:hypothetical protein n=1 Tax=Cellulosimicrobium cellulans TaxID=1710 RepID=UPI00380DDD10